MAWQPGEVVVDATQQMATAAAAAAAAQRLTFDKQLVTTSTQTPGQQRALQTGSLPSPARSHLRRLSTLAATSPPLPSVRRQR